MKFKHGTRRRALEYEKDWVKRWKADATFEKSVETNHSFSFDFCMFALHRNDASQVILKRKENIDQSKSNQGNSLEISN